jgi:hypothetical protein
MPDERDYVEDEEWPADLVLLSTWREWQREVTREVAEAEAVAAMESSPLFGGVLHVNIRMSSTSVSTLKASAR